MDIKKEDIRFAIVSKNEVDVTIVVSYWVDGYTMQVAQNIQLPVEPETFAIPSGAALTELIMNQAPVDQLSKDIDHFKNGVMVDFTEIDGLIIASAALLPKF